MKAWAERRSWACGDDLKRWICCSLVGLVDANSRPDYSDIGSVGVRRPEATDAGRRRSCAACRSQRHAAHSVRPFSNRLKKRFAAWPSLRSERRRAFYPIPHRRQTSDPCADAPSASAVALSRAAPFRRTQAALRSTQAGAWSLAPASPRTSRSTPAPDILAAAGRFKRRWSNPSPAFLGHRFRR
jgi:hypothetical protein